MSALAGHMPEDEILRRVGELLSEARSLTEQAPASPGTRFLDYMISLALVEATHHGKPNQHQE